MRLCSVAGCKERANAGCQADSRKRWSYCNRRHCICPTKIEMKIEPSDVLERAEQYIASQKRAFSSWPTVMPELMEEVKKLRAEKRTLENKYYSYQSTVYLAQLDLGDAQRKLTHAYEMGRKG